MENLETGLEIVEAFKNHLQQDGKASSTIESYITDTTAFIIWFAEKGTPFDGRLKRFHVTSYNTFIQQSGYSPVTINKIINSLQSFNSFLIETKYIVEQVVDVKRDKVKIASGSEKEVQILTDRESELLLFNLSDRRRFNSRDSLIINLLLYTGLRVSELVSLRLKDIDMLAATMTVAWGKGGKYREVPLRQEVVEAIKEYTGTERKYSKFNSSDYLILTVRAEKADRDTINKVLQRIGKMLDIEMYPHKCRHTFCTRLVKRGVELTTVAKLAGHASIQTTANFYINTSKKDKQDAIALL